MSYGTLLIALSALLQVDGAPGPKPAPFTSKVGGFTINFPGPPTESYQTEKAEIGTMINRVYQLAGADLVYTLICADYPSKLKPEDEEDFLEGVLKGYAKSAVSKRMSLSKIRFDDVAAREVKVRLQQGVFHARYFIKRKRIYQIILYCTDPKASDDDEFKRFADSFRSFEPVGKLADGLDALSTWKVYRSKEGGFNVRMLGDPKESVQSIEVPNGAIELRMVNCSNTRSENFGVTYSPVTKADPPVAPEALYESAVNGAAENLKGKVTVRKAIEYEGHHGVEAEISLPGTQPFPDGVFFARMFWVGDRLYQVVYVGPRSNAKSQEVVSFLDSFHLEDKMGEKTPIDAKKDGRID